jgi:hypothetical protein
MSEPIIAAWEVRAGVIPGSPVGEYSKKFLYTLRDKQEDISNRHDLSYQSLFAKQMACASAYHQQMSEPDLNNWAELTFVWF